MLGVPKSDHPQLCTARSHLIQRLAVPESNLIKLTLIMVLQIKIIHSQYLKLKCGQMS